MDLLKGTADVVQVLLERELWCVYADHDSALRVFLRPGSKVRQRAEPVDAREGAEVDDDDFSKQALRGQRWRVEPLGPAGDGRQLARDALRRFRSVPDEEPAEQTGLRRSDRHCRPPEKTPSSMVDSRIHDLIAHSRTERDAEILDRIKSVPPRRIH